jgi:hypothetical protein
VVVVLAIALADPPAAMAPSVVVYDFAVDDDRLANHSLVVPTRSVASQSSLEDGVALVRDRLVVGLCGVSVKRLVALGPNLPDRALGNRLLGILVVVLVALLLVDDGDDLRSSSRMDLGDRLLRLGVVAIVVTIFMGLGERHGTGHDC